MLEKFVWLEHTKKAINMDLVTDFWLGEEEGALVLLFRYVGSNDNGARIHNQEDIHDFLQNVARVDNLSSALSVSQVVETVEKGASLVGMSIGSL